MSAIAAYAFTTALYSKAEFPSHGYSHVQVI